MTVQVIGRNQYIMPDAHHGWCVVDEMDKEIIHHFLKLDEALEYAYHKADHVQGKVVFQERSNPNALSCYEQPHVYQREKRRLGCLPVQP